MGGSCILTTRPSHETIYLFSFSLADTISQQVVVLENYDFVSGRGKRDSTVAIAITPCFLISIAYNKPDFSSDVSLYQIFPPVAPASLQRKRGLLNCDSDAFVGSYAFVPQVLAVGNIPAKKYSNYPAGSAKAFLNNTTKYMLYRCV